MPKCRYKVGLLNLQDCGKEGVNVCASCNRPICGAHSKILEQKTLCLECYVNTAPEKDDVAGDEEFGAARRRNRIYQTRGFHPYYYGSGRRYGNDDYNNFDDDYKPDTDGKEDVEPSDFQES